jgi:hypothetical protein
MEYYLYTTLSMALPAKTTAKSTAETQAKTQFDAAMARAKTEVDQCTAAEANAAAGAAPTANIQGMQKVE